MRHWSWIVGPVIALPVIAASVGPIELFSAQLLAPVVALDRLSMGMIVSLRRPILTKFMTSVTGLGSASAAATFLAMCYLADWDREARLAGVSLLTCGVVVVSLMTLIQRPFPPESVCVTTGSGLTPHSFPSGHAAAVTAIAATAYESDELPFGPVAVLAGLVALSRVYLGTHFLSDTAVGVGIGLGAVVVGRWVLRRTALGESSPAR